MENKGNKYATTQLLSHNYRRALTSEKNMNINANGSICS